MPRRAFTLMEVLLTILILGLIFGFVYPDLDRALKSRALQESADRLRSLIIMCRAKSLQDGLRYRLEFPGTPDPLDRHADKDVDVPFETLQPLVKRQNRPLEYPDSYEDVHEEWTDQEFLRPGVRCVAVLPGQPDFTITPNSPIAGPSISEGTTQFVPLTFNPDGTADWVTFVLTDLAFEVKVEAGHITHILNLIVDGRTAQTWFQRALRVEEVEVMQEYGASPILRMDFTSPDLITEENILEVHVSTQGSSIGRRQPVNRGGK